MKFADHVFKLLPKSQIGRSVVVLAGGTATAQAISIVAMPIITRLYSPAEIGVVSVFTAFAGFWASILSWRYELALLNAADDRESYLIFRICIGLIFIMSTLSVPVLYGLIFTDTLGFGFLPSWSPLVGIPIFLGLGIFMAYRIWGLRSGLVSYVSKATVAQSVSNVIAQVVLGLLGGGVPGLFGARLLSAWSGIGALHRIVHIRYRKSRSILDWQTLKTVVSRYSKFPKYEMPSTMLDQLAMVIPIPMLAALYGVQAAGWFGLARSLVAIPNTQIGNAVADVFHMELAQKVRAGDSTAAHKLFYNLLRKLSLFGLLPFVGTIVLGPRLVPWIFGKPWAEMGIIAAYIAPWLYAALIVSSLSRLLSVLEHQEYKLIYDIYVLFSMLLVYMTARHWSLGLIQTVMLLTVAYIMGYLLYLCLLLRVMNNYVKNSNVLGN